MRHYGWTIVLSVTLIAACGESTPRGGHAEDGASPAAASRGQPMSSRGEAPAGAVALEITGEVGGREVHASGRGECQHAAHGSIYQRPASLWTVQFGGGEDGRVRRLTLAFWRERSGTESVTLALDVGGETHRIATVEGGERQGSGLAGLEEGTGSGVLTVEGTSSAGAQVRLRVRCERFTTLVAEGG